MSVVMSTMAKQQPSATPVFKGLNSICEKLKRSTEDEDDDTADDTGDEDDMYRHNGRSGEVATTSADAGSGLMFDSDDDNSNTEYGLSYSAAFSATNDVAEDGGSVSTPPSSAPGGLNETASGGERRNKRKNFKPRNIVYQYESCGEGLAEDDYSTTSTGDLMTPGRCSGDEVATASNQRLMESEEECQQAVELNEGARMTLDFETTGTGPMDLSVRSHSPGGDNMSDNSEDSDSLAMDLTKGPKDANAEGDHSSCSSDAHPNMGATSPSCGMSPNDDPSQQYPSASRLRTEDVPWEREGCLSVPTSPTVTGPLTGDASTLKDYAESTMKELLGLYGFNDMTAESLTKNVPLDNFSSGKILQTMSPHSLSSFATKSKCSMPPTSLASAIQASNNKRTPSPQQSSQQPLHQMRSQHLASSESNYDNLCTKMVDSMAKFSRLPPNSIIGNPRVILPPNMTSTILTLAAMQESKFAAAAAMAANSTHIPKAPPLQHILPQRKSQPSVIVSSSSSVLPLLSHKEHLNKSGPIDYTRYVKRYSNANECGSNYCKDLNYREHFHCMDCNSRVFVKKEEMIRHFKWHKKRDESLQHGFLRFSPMDDCFERFPNCSHNRKQTHYHCLKEGCDKVYISTSDVQMHANYHRKDSAIIQEGFQRFRATEDCAMLSCSFYGQRTTHFHCRRANCNFTFKNKADMEKHKSYHIKDEQLNKDGFKKFMKHEHCSYENCRYSRVCNHIHCIRAGCTYVLHSSGQLYSHKRKHERRDNELAYRKYKLAQSMLKTLGDGPAMTIPSQMSEEGNSSESTGSGIHTQGSVLTAHSGSANNNITAPGASTASGLQSAAGTSTPTTHTSTNSNSALSYPLSNHFNLNYQSLDPQALSRLASLLTGVNLNSQLSLPVLLPGSKAEQLLASGQLGAEHLAAIDHLTNDLLKPKPDDSWKKYLIRYTANDPCKPNCDFLYKDHYHCTTESCTMMFRSKDGVREHARTHEQQDQVTEAFYTTQEAGQPSSCPSDCPYQNKEKHYHCGWDNCNEIIMPSDKAFRRLDHYKMHDYSRKLNTGKDPLNMTLATTMDSMFKRKRGRPPKNRVIEFPMPSSPSELPQAIFTSFKLPKPSPPHVGLGATAMGTTTTTQSYMDSTPISAVAMPFGLLPGAVLPSRAACSSLVGTPTTLPLPLMSQIAANTMQSKVEDLEGFYVFPQNTPCPDHLCPHLAHLHYHCMKNRCHYTTDKVDILAQHTHGFHGTVEILEGFAYFDRYVDCRFDSCPNNKISRHYHCTRDNCNYSFIQYSKMLTHEQEQHCDEKGSTSLCSPPPLSLPSQTHSFQRIPSPRIVMTDHKTTVVKATGTFYPLSALPLKNTGKENGQLLNGNGQSGNSSVRSDDDGDDDNNQCLSQLLQQYHSGTFIQQPYWQIHMDHSVEFGPNYPCGRPFCKLKKSQHYHCKVCNQAFSNYLQLAPHLAKHTDMSHPFSASHGGPSSNDNNSDDGEFDLDNEHVSTPSSADATAMRRSPHGPHVHMNISAESIKNLHPNLFQTPVTESPIYFPPQGSLMSMPGYHTLLSHHPHLVAPRLDDRSSPQHNGSSNNEFDAEHSSQGSPYSNSCIASPTVEDCGEANPNSPRFMGATRKRTSSTSPRNEDFGGSECKKIRATAALASLRILKDEPVPQGYIRYRFNEDCQYTHCGYREHQTHFHCVRRDCGYSFCDKTRFVQHTARHERLDTLMGGDFQQFRANVACGRPECLYTVAMATSSGSSTNKASHFHCLKCEYVCTDTNKVVAHRRQHQKLDNIMAAGFEKFTPTQNCNMEGCTHNQKQTHYHCMKCQYAVLGLSQMSAHKYRHLE
uniref:C2H2-type domain-containing protein n=1 Tax=Strigamia maritima TaxID=126957 RepID=T1IV78_STRMM